MRTAGAGAASAAAAPLSTDERWGAWLLRHLEHLPGVKIPYKDLALIGKSPAQHMLTKVAATLGGLLIPAVLWAALTMLSVNPPLPIPAAAGLVLGSLLGGTALIRRVARRRTSSKA